MRARKEVMEGIWRGAEGTQGSGRGEERRVGNGS